MQALTFSPLKPMTRSQTQVDRVSTLGMRSLAAFALAIALEVLESLWAFRPGFISCHARNCHQVPVACKAHTHNINNCIEKSGRHRWSWNLLPGEGRRGGRAMTPRGKEKHGKEEERKKRSTPPTWKSGRHRRHACEFYV